MIRSQALMVNSDHQNLLYQSMSSQRIVCWGLMLKKWHPIIKYAVGADNTDAGALSQLDIDNKVFNIIYCEIFPKLKHSNRTKDEEGRIKFRHANVW